MDWEAPADAWYIFLAVSIISVALAGVVLGLPTGATPDSNQAANTIDSVSGGSPTVTGSYEHDAEMVKIDGNTIVMKNEHGESRETLRYGGVVVVNGFDRLENIAYGSSFEAEFEDEIDDPFTDAGTEFFEQVSEADDQNAGEWNTSDGELSVTTVEIEPEPEPSMIVTISETDEAYDDQEITIPETIHITSQNVDHLDSLQWDWRVDYQKEVWDNPDFEDSSSFSEWVESTLCGSWNPLCDEGEEPVPSTHAEGTVSFHTSTVTEDLNSSLNRKPYNAEVWVGDYSNSDPLEVELTYDSPTGDHSLDCSGQLGPDDVDGDSVDLCPGLTSPDEFEDAQWIEADEAEDTFYVTIVTV